MIRCVVIDDEPLAQEVLEAYIKQVPDMQVAGKFSNARDALQFLKAHPVDAIFLDIEMPEISGIDFLRSLSPAPLTVFTTAYRDYAFEGFELGVIDFLLKPIVYNRFQSAMEKIRDFLALKNQDAHFEAGNPDPEFIFVKSGVQRIKLYFNKVTHIQGLKDYAIIHTGGQKIVIKGSVKSMQAIFREPHFIRVHKSFIAARDKITRMENRKVIIEDHHIPVGRSYKDELERILNNK